MARYAGLEGSRGQLKLSWSTGEQEGELSTPAPLAQQTLPLEDAPLQLRLEDRGSGRTFARVVMTGLAPLGQELALSEGLEVRVDYGPAGSQGRLSPEQLTHGTDFVARVTVRNTSGLRLPELALTHVVAAGWELSRVGSGPGEGYEYRDVRDDRVLTYFDLDAGQEAVFTVPLNATYRGRFYLPGVSVEQMYDSRYRARTAGRWVEVVLPGQQG